MIFFLRDYRTAGSNKGEGVRGEGDWWEVTPAAEGKVIVEARDLAGNVVELVHGE